LTYNKQCALADSDGRATSDPRVIGKVSWRLLRALDIAPHELRGISIQIQKLEARTPCAPTPGQARLPFRREPNSTGANARTGPAPKARAPSSELVIAQPDPKPKPKAPAPAPAPAPSTGVVDLPSFSQVDMSVFQALPDDVRRELEAEYERRGSAPPPPHVKPEVGTDEPPHRSASEAPSRAANDQPRVRGTSARASASRGGSRSRRGRANWRGAPPSRGRSSLPPLPPGAVPASTAGVRVKPAELAELGIDPDVFSALPLSIQREQLAAARGARVRPSQQPVRPTSPLKPLQRLAGRWAPPKGPHEHIYIPPPPPPRARFAEAAADKPALRPWVGAGGNAGAEAAGTAVVEDVDVRKAVKAWLERFVGHAPCGGDVGCVGTYLVRCVETDVGAERAVGVMRWWGALLRRRWAVWEHADERDEEPEPGEDVRAEMVGMAWWRAYREIGNEMNDVVRKRFGGSLKFR
jgi:DNA repair protein REV1